MYNKAKKIVGNMFLFGCILSTLTLVLVGSEMSSDDRNWLMRKVMSMDQTVSVPFFYPRLFPVVRSTKQDQHNGNSLYFLQNLSQIERNFDLKFSTAAVQPVIMFSSTSVLTCNSGSFFYLWMGSFIKYWFLHYS